ncbi:TetR/AcrR family transcriptional regulator [Anoxybacterium hadale]|uniref:TetR/AcrR family transcriptional regulator n=1 Tax=Anoxybacterium hadale TaxID=3408580 RepID=A0ACD1AI08_9FIRM|nr:TetR/AcrR family transcriptional regulator [Clostridiales bacterium]
MRNKTDKGLRERILIESVRLFSEKGYHGTSMRDIAERSECSLPMLYYYYKNKADLFYEVAYNEFVLLIERLNEQVTIGATIQETYFNAIKQRKELSSYDKAVYKLSLKVWLGFDGESKVRKDLIEWENGRMERTKKILEKYIENKTILHDISNLFVRVMENVIEKIILLDEEVSDEDINNEIELLMKLSNL